MRRNVFRVLSFLFALALMGGIGFAEEPPKKPANRSQLGSRPTTESDVEVFIPFGDRSRKIEIHREDPNAERPVGRYFHRPIFALRTRADAGVEKLAGYPETVLGVDATSDLSGHIIVSFSALLSSPEFRSFCRATVIEHDSNYWSTKGVTEDKVEVKPWPITHAVIECKDTGTREILAFDETDSLTGIDDFLDFTLRFTPEKLSRFLTLAEGRNLAFVFTYSYIGRQTFSGTRTVKGVKDMSSEINSSLSAQQRTGGAPIFQGNKDQVSRRISARVVSETRIQHKDLFPLVDSQVSKMVDSLFEPAQTLSLDELRKNNPQAEAQLAAYLQPLITREIENEARQEATTTTDQTAKTNTTTVGGGFGINLGIIKFGVDASGQQTEQVMNQVQKMSGMSFQKGTEKNSFVPYDIRVFKLSQGWESITFSEEGTAYLSIGDENAYRVDTPVPLRFTATNVKTAVTNYGKEAVEFGHRYSPVGSLISYAGQNPEELKPLDWLVCDGRPLKKDEFALLFSRLGVAYGAGKPRSGKEEPGDFNLPDLRGQFLRGMDPDGMNDPEGKNRAVGSEQGDAIQRHGHVEEGSHVHSYVNRLRIAGLDAISGPLGIIVPPDAPAALTRNRPTLIDWMGHYPTMLMESPPPLVTTEPRKPEDPKQQVQVYDPLTAKGKTANFATETRPKNIAVWILIRAR